MLLHLQTLTIQIVDTPVRSWLFLSHAAATRPATHADAIKECNPIHYPNIRVMLLFAFRDLWKEMGRQFSDPYRTASSTTGDWSRWIILMCFIYIILSTTVSHFWTLRKQFFFQSSFFVYISIFASVLCI